MENPVWSDTALMIFAFIRVMTVSILAVYGYEWLAGARIG
jgi:hypothetical protein